MKRFIPAAFALVVLLPAARAGAVDPVGALEAADCAGVRGWAQDADQPTVAIDVHVYFNGPPGDPLGTGIAVNAKETRDDLCMMLGSCEHGYALELPLGVRDGAAHNVWVYGIDLEAVNNPLLGGPIEVTCPPPPIVGGVRRHIMAPEHLTAWQFSTFVDLLHVDDAGLLAVPESDPWPIAPTLVTSDAGDGVLWIIDGTARREVPADVVDAWRFVVANAVVTPAAELDAMPLGPDLRVRPFLVQGTMPEVYLLDDAPCGADGCPEGGSTDGGDSGGDDPTATESGDDPTGDPTVDPSDTTEGSSGTADTTAAGIDPGGDDAPAESSGCGCTSTPVPGAAAWLVVLVALFRRRQGGEQTSKCSNESSATRSIAPQLPAEMLTNTSSSAYSSS